MFQELLSTSPRPFDESRVSDLSNTIADIGMIRSFQPGIVGMNALGIACENVAMVIGQPWTALWLIFWVITNVATSFYSIELAPNFFRVSKQLSGVISTPSLSSMF